MNSFAVVFACLVVYANAKPSGLWAHGHGHLPLVGASGVVSSYGAVGPAGIVTGHGAIGPHGIGHVGHVGHLGHVIAHGHDDGQWHGEGLLESQDWAGHHGLHGVVGPAAHIVGAHAHGAVVAGHAGAIISHSHPGVVIGHHGHW